MDRKNIERILDHYEWMTSKEKSAAYSVLTSLEGLTTKDAVDVLDLCKSVLEKIIGDMVLF